MNTRDRISQILSSLERTNEDLLDLSDDIWLSIDHNDTEEMDAAIEFKRQYNKAMDEFARMSARIQGLISEYTRVEADAEATPIGADTAEVARVIRELDRAQSHRLDEDFRYKRPYGFAFGDYAVKDVHTWRAIYERVCHMVAKQQGESFSQVTSDPAFESSRGNRMFATTNDAMRKASEVTPGVWVETNLSANDIRDRICALLEFFDYDWTELRVYLREDRDAQD